MGVPASQRARTSTRTSAPKSAVASPSASMRSKRRSVTGRAPAYDDASQRSLALATTRSPRSATTEKRPSASVSTVRPSSVVMCAPAIGSPVRPSRTTPSIAISCDPQPPSATIAPSATSRAVRRSHGSAISSTNASTPPDSRSERRSWTRHGALPVPSGSASVSAASSCATCEPIRERTIGASLPLLARESMEEERPSIRRDRSAMLARMCSRMGVAAFAIALAIGAPRAHAFERSTVEGDPSTPLFWRYRTVYVRPAYDTSEDVPSESVRVALARSIATWNAAAEPCSDVRLEDRGYPTGFSTNLAGGPHDGENRVVFREDAWPEELPFGTLAITTTVYRRATGEVLDADIDVNGVEYEWTDTSDPALAVTDVQNTLTHELGHVLGLAHSNDPVATMYAESPPGDLEKRTLAEDDIAGLCFVYPDGLLSPDAPLLANPSLTGCAIGRGRGAPWLALAIAAALIRRRRRGAPRRARWDETAS